MSGAAKQAPSSRDRTHPNSKAFPRGVSGPALRALAAAGVVRLDDLRSRRLAELRPLHGMGPKALEILRMALAKQGADSRGDDPEDLPMVVEIGRSGAV